LEKIEWLIDKLKRQYDAAAGAAPMLTTLQLMQQELTAQTAAEPTLVGRIAVIMPAPQWNTNTDSLLDAYEAEVNRGEDEQKMVFELEPYLGQDEEEEEALNAELAASESIAEETLELPDEEESQPEVELPKPVYEAPKPAYEAPKPVYEAPKPLPEPPAETKPAVVAPTPLHTTYLPEQKTEEQVWSPVFPLSAGEIPPSVSVVEMPNPVPETDKKSLNDLLEKPAGDMYVRFQEPIKDLKRAISINDRYQYINNLFSGDEVAFDRSIKTVNSFNVFSEAEYWIRREIATRYGWEESDSLVQQFYSLVSRRFS
jgi:hypothetical protein